MCEYIIMEDFKMEKYIYDENNGLWYELQGDYYLPCLTLPPEEEKPIDKGMKSYYNLLCEYDFIL